MGQQTIEVGQLAPGAQWDQTLLADLLSNKLYPTDLSFHRCSGYPNADGCVLLIPGRYWWDRTDEISNALSRYDWVLGLLTGDEEALFDVGKIGHNNIRWWVQSPRPDRDYGDARLVGLGYTPHCRTQAVGYPTKELDIFLAAQDTHDRRTLAFAALRGSPFFNMLLLPTEGFTCGMKPDAYATAMRNTRVAPAPAGPATPDTFRVYEALQAHAIPIADDVTPGYPSRGFWRNLYPDAPFPILTDYTHLSGQVHQLLESYPSSANEVAAWWMRQKREYARWLRSDLTALGAL